MFGIQRGDEEGDVMEHQWPLSIWILVGIGGVLLLVIVERIFAFVDAVIYRIKYGPLPRPKEHDDD